MRVRSCVGLVWFVAKFPIAETRFRCKASRIKFAASVKSHWDSFSSNALCVYQTYRSTMASHVTGGWYIVLTSGRSAIGHSPFIKRRHFGLFTTLLQLKYVMGRTPSLLMGENIRNSGS
jgi:hypothetical protein